MTPLMASRLFGIGSHVTHKAVELISQPLTFVGRSSGTKMKMFQHSKLSSVFVVCLRVIVSITFNKPDFYSALISIITVHK